MNKYHDILIIGAGGLAIQSLNLIIQKYKSPAFYDEFSKENYFHSFPLYHSTEIVRICNRFIPLISDIKNRKILIERFKDNGGTLDSLISPDFPNNVAYYNSWVWHGTILDECLVEQDVILGSNILINKRCSIHHDTKIGKNVTLSPNVTILGNCEIGDDTFIGAGVIIREKVKIGKNCILGMGSVVLEDIPDNSVAYGHPCKVIRKNK